LKHIFKFYFLLYRNISDINIQTLDIPMTSSTSEGKDHYEVGNLSLAPNDSVVKYVWEIDNSGNYTTTQVGKFFNENAPTGTYPVKVWIYTASGNIIMKEMEVGKDDTTPPVITLNGSASISIALNGTYTELGATATDDVDGDYVEVYTVGTVDTSTAGTYTITYTAIDSFNNEANATRTVTVGSQTVNLTNGLVAHYEFEGNANDSSGNGNHGTPYGGVSYADGVIGQAGSFDGVDGRIKINHSILNNKDEFSISFWANTKKESSAILSGANTTNDNEFLIYLNSTTNIELYYHADYYNSSFFTSNIRLTHNKYSLITIKFYGDKTIIYENGTLKQELNNGYGSDIQIDENGLWVGLEQDNVGEHVDEDTQYFYGQIDDLRIYNRALNESEIEALYQMGQPNDTNTTFSYYDDFTKSGDIITDNTTGLQWQDDTTAASTYLTW
jgi:hypothetical protein